MLETFSPRKIITTIIKKIIRTTHHSYTSDTNLRILIIHTLHTHSLHTTATIIIIIIITCKCIRRNHQSLHNQIRSSLIIMIVVVIIVVFLLLLLLLLFLHIRLSNLFPSLPIATPHHGIL